MTVKTFIFTLIIQNILRIYFRFKPRGGKKKKLSAKLVLFVWQQKDVNTYNLFLQTHARTSIILNIFLFFFLILSNWIYFNTFFNPFQATPFPNSFKCFTCDNAVDNYNCNRWAEDRWCPESKAGLGRSLGYLNLINWYIQHFTPWLSPGRSLAVHGINEPAHFCHW